MNEEFLESPFSPPLHLQRKKFISNELYYMKKPWVKHVLFVGCGKGNVMKYVIKDKFKRMVGIDVCKSSLEFAYDNTKPSAEDFIKPLSPPLSIEFRLFDVSVVQKKEDLEWCEGIEGVVCTEVIEHINSGKLHNLESFIFHHVRPRIVIVTTPNKDFNRWWWPNDEEWKVNIRDVDHKFEWTRKEFGVWASMIEKKYKVTGVGEWEQGDPEEKLKHGYATQIAVFLLQEEEVDNNNNKWEENKWGGEWKTPQKHVSTKGAKPLFKHEYPTRDEQWWEEKEKNWKSKNEQVRGYDQHLIEEMKYMYGLMKKFLPRYQQTEGHEGLGFIPLDLICERIKKKGTIDTSVLIMKEVVEKNPSSSFTLNEQKNAIKLVEKMEMSED